MRNFAAYIITATLSDKDDIAIYRGTKREERGAKSVLIKVPTSAHPSVATIRRLEREYDIARELDPALIARPFELVRHAGAVALVLEDDNLTQTLASILGAPMQLGRFLRIAIGAAKALIEIHSHDLVHKDLKPQNILVNAGTGQIRITGLGIASRVAHGLQSMQSPGLIEGTLAYMSPEQTGRMNRLLDYRSDFYSLGVTLYQMLVGELPFQARDPMEWVYCHIAQAPPFPKAAGVPVPKIVGEIVMKLLAKVAEDRYQSAAGLLRDLEKCQRQWNATGRIEGFVLGEGELRERFQIPRKLYGREEEICELLSAFDRVATQGGRELVLVSGYSGIGKSELVQELHQPIVRKRGFFITGKFEQLKRDIPYSTLVQAFRQLIQQILAESDPQIAFWKEQIAEALGANGQLICALIPEVEWIVGRPPPVVELPLTQAQSRFHLVFQRFLSVFAKADHPLTLFLDDLQWSDSASLQLLQYLLSNPETRHLLVVGAYRDNEVSPSHPLLLTLDEIRARGAPVRSIVLSPLSIGNLNRLIADALQCNLNHAALLARLVHEKTGGNPFFAIQFLTGLYREGLIVFDTNEAAWQWNIERIRAGGYTDNVVDFLIAKLSKLSSASRNAMQLAACIGQKGPLRTLALIYGKPEEEVLGDLGEAIGEGLVLRVGEDYQFLHDRVQEAAYALTPENQTWETHLRIGRLLLLHTPSQEAVGGKIFNIVNQLNRGATLISSQEEKVKVAELNLIAGTRAKASTAYTSAISYFSAGLTLLGDGLWDCRQDLAYQLCFGKAQCEDLDGNFEEALRRFDALLEHAETKLQKAEIYCAEVDIYTRKTEMAKAVQLGIEGLGHFGIELSPHPTREQMLADYDTLWRNLGDRQIEELATLPRMTDPEMHAVMSLLEVLYTGALCTDQNLFVSWACHMVDISLCHGNCDASAMGYAYLGLALGPVFGQYSEGYRFGKLGYDLVEKQRLLAYKAKINFIFGDCINYWRHHLRTDLEYLQEAFQTAVDVGDLITACYCCNHLVINFLVLGRPLESVHREAQRRLEFTRKVRLDASSQAIIAMDRVVQNLRGLTAHFSTFSDGDFNEDQYQAFMDGYGKPITTCWFYIMKLQARFMSEDFEEAIAAAHKAKPLLWATQAHIQETEYWFYYPLALAACYSQASPARQTEILETLLSHQTKLRDWAENCPENFLSKYALVSAEIARITAKPLQEILQLYEQAIQSARDHGFVQVEGIANELAARMAQEQGFETIARAYLREARYCYVRWGADGKVKQLERTHPWLLEKAPMESGATIAVLPEQLDLMTVVKAGQAISGEIIADRLIETLLRIVLESAGAQKGCLFVEPDAQIFAAIRSEQGAGQIEFHRAPVESGIAFATSILNYVKRTNETVILSDATTDAGQFSADQYMRYAKPKSVLCMPILRQAKLLGVLYLENNLATGAFTPDRRAVLEILASQAAISLDNALVYEALRQSEQKFRVIFDQTIQFIGVLTVDGIMLRANQAALRFAGISEEAVFGKPFWETPWWAHSEELRQKLRESIQEAASGKLVRFEATHITTDGQMRYIDFSLKPVTNAEGHVVQLIPEGRDITERKLAEEALRISSERLQLATRVAKIGIWDWDVVRNELVWDDSMYQLYGIEKADFGGAYDAWIGTIHPEDKAYTDGEIQAALRGEHEYAPEFRIIHPDGSIRYIKADSKTIHDPAGKPLRMIGTNIDITEGKSIEEKIRKLNAELEQRVVERTKALEAANKELESFSYSVSHDLRAPLRAIDGFSRLLQKDYGGKFDTKGQENLGRVVASCKHMGQLIDGLLELSRLTRSEVRRSPLDLSKLAKSVAKDLQQIDPERCVKFIIEPDLVVEADPVLMQSVLENLLGNAWKFTGKIPAAHIEFGQYPQESGPIFFVRDNGAGFDMAYADKLFGEFQRMHSVKDFPGSGIGLATVQRIIQKHGGRIWAESEVGKGATFYFTLPSPTGSHALSRHPALLQTN